MAPSYPPPPPPRRSSAYPPPQGTHAAPKSYRGLIWFGGAALFITGLLIGALAFSGDPAPVPAAAAVAPTESVIVTESVTVTSTPEVTATATITASPTPTKTPTPTPRTTTRERDPRRDDDGVPRPRSVEPGEPCSPEGAIGFADGRMYICKGPGTPRWQR